MEYLGCEPASRWSGLRHPIATSSTVVIFDLIYLQISLEIMLNRAHSYCLARFAPTWAYYSSKLIGAS